jgi:glyoxylase-like metal-dependent hydrolase (beta-lactamase superfamily II)
MDPASGNIILTIQSFLVRTSHHTILVDTCVGDHKPRPNRPQWDMLKLNTFLPRLAQAGVSPEDVDYVMCTHLHWDHVGWNTQLHNGRWVPTFPNAKYIFAKRELQAWEDLHRQEPQPHYTDSILPVIEAGKAQLVASDYALDDEVWLEPTPGHTPDHVSIRLASQGQQGVITGDMIHNPIQCLKPGWIMRADFEPDRAVTTRQQFLDQYCNSGVVVCATHFPEPSIGHIVPRADAFEFAYEE